MEQSKLDNHIKQKLEERTIAPSENTWGRISAELEATNKPNKLWYWMAASAVILIAVSAFFFSQKEQTKTPIQVVQEEITLPKKEKVEDKIVEMPVENESIVIIEKEKPVLDKDVVQKENTEQIYNDERLADSNETSIVMVDTLQKTLNFEDQKALEVATKINELQKQGNVTDAEIEALLLQAQKEIKAQRAFENNTRVDAMALLLDAEAELNKPFKERVFEMLKEGFEKAKTVVAERD